MREQRIVAANLVIGSGGGGTLVEGRSAPLSSSADRSRFHAIRSAADLIIIGGVTARHEPYEKTPCDLLVLSRSASLGRAAANPRARTANLAIADAIASAHDYSHILIEAGVTILHEALRAGLITTFYLTETDVPASEGRFDRALLVENFRCESRTEGEGETFSVWKAR